MTKKIILITGAAGFIGGNLIRRLINDCTFPLIIGVDNLNDYYDVRLKNYRLQLIANAALNSPSNFLFFRGDISDKNFISELFRCYQPSLVVNLAAQAGVRYSLVNPDAFIQSNVVGFFNMLEACRNAKNLCHLIYASSSSVYGGNKKIPFSTADRVDNPLSLYAATKMTDELLAHCYSVLYKIPATGLRFFTVYGAAGRPDMAYFKFTDKFLRGEDIQLFNHGNCARDFTYIDDVVDGILRVIARPPAALHNVYNIGTGKPVVLLDFIKILQDELVRAQILPPDFNFDKYIKLVPAQAGDVTITFADTRDFERVFDFRPKTSLRAGIRYFATWFKKFYKGV